MRAVRSISTTFGSGFVSRASASLSPASQSAGANDAGAAGDAPAMQGVQASHAKNNIWMQRTEKYFDDTAKDLPCDVRGRGNWPTIRASAVLYSRLKPISLQPARARGRRLTFGYLEGVVQIGGRLAGKASSPRQPARERQRMTAVIPFGQ